ncbi:hypothetical protein NI17_007845 [Thermobifida halotolerans]|uniref:Uncharacterized protein n=1 Tax=Thermobifida halotolerans TaxID=483545 RepID=A0AA97LZM0_9ACTN|nr:DUF6624 domain-containing protein [Thermobifida halotolerans]UOE21049.1 hypothetical protein NI17_007845 [Thermobifida halotolerans]
MMHDHTTEPRARLREELLARARRDTEARTAVPVGRDPEEWRRAVAPVDRDNTAWLRDVIGEHGWPGRSLVGEDGAHAAWLLVQHAPHDLQQRCLPLLREAVAAGEAEATELAYLEDRVRCHEGMPQRYGTQYLRLPDGEVRLYEVEDPEGLDERRAAVGLEPHSDYDTRIRAGA